MTTATVDMEARVAAAYGEILASRVGIRGGRTVRLAYLRRALGDAERGAVDAALLAMVGRGAAVLGRLGDYRVGTARARAADAAAALWVDGTRRDVLCLR